jgi:hypothetical protein
MAAASRKTGRGKKARGKKPNGKKASPRTPRSRVPEVMTDSQRARAARVLHERAPDRPFESRDRVAATLRKAAPKEPPVISFSDTGG